MFRSGAARPLVITGANSGLGLGGGAMRCAKGAQVVLACRDRRARADGGGADPRPSSGAHTTLMALDLSSLADIRRFAGRRTRRPSAHRRPDEQRRRHGARRYRRTADGFEMQFGTNHLGHFALTGLLLGRMLAGGTGGARRRRSAAARTTCGSIAVRRSPDAEHGLPQVAGVRTEQARQPAVRVRAATRAACGRRMQRDQRRRHPGYRRHQSAGCRAADAGARRCSKRLMEIGNALFSQSAAMGALPQIYAAVVARRARRRLLRPDGIGELWGHPAQGHVERGARSDVGAARRLWTLSGTAHRGHVSARHGGMSWRRTLLLTAGIGAAVIAVGLLFVVARLDDVVQGVIERRGAALDRHAGSCRRRRDRASARGRATLHGLTVANPPGFTAPNALSLGEVQVQTRPLVAAAPIPLVI